MKKKLAFVLSLVLVCGMTACGGSDTADTTASGGGNTAVGTSTGSTDNKELYTLKLAYSPSLCQAPLHVATVKGFFEAEGLNVEPIQIDASKVQEAIGANQVDAAFGLIGKMLQPVENGLGIKFTAGIHTGCIKISAPKDSGINSIADLKGKRIGVPGIADASTIVLKRALAAENISFNERDPELEIVVFSKNDLGQALENGAIDAIALNDPTASQFEEEYDLNVILDTAADEPYKDEYCCAAFVSDKLAEEHPDIAAAYTRAVLKASVWVEEHPEEAAQIQLDQDIVTGDAAFNGKLLDSYNYIPSVQGGYDAIRLSVEQLSQIGVLQEGTNAQEFTDKVYLFFDDVPDSYTVDDIADIK